jgi:hypothetical protein
MHANLIRKMHNANQLKCQRVYQPHVRIEIEDIHDVPVVYVDGKRRFNIDTDEPLMDLIYDWHTNTAVETKKSLKVKYVDTATGNIIDKTISNIYRS